MAASRPARARRSVSPISLTDGPSTMRRSPPPRSAAQAYRPRRPPRLTGRRGSGPARPAGAPRGARRSRRRGRWRDRSGTIRAAMPYIERVKPGASVSLRDVDPGAHAGIGREEAERRSAALIDELDTLQEELYAAGQNALLIVLQGLDTSGKDGTIRHVLR